jgi:hypothetical protein
MRDETHLRFRVDQEQLSSCILRGIDGGARFNPPKLRATSTGTVAGKGPGKVPKHVTRLHRPVDVQDTPSRVLQCARKGHHVHGVRCDQQVTRHQSQPRDLGASLRVEDWGVAGGGPGRLRLAHCTTTVPAGVQQGCPSRQGTAHCSHHCKSQHPLHVGHPSHASTNG